MKLSLCGELSNLRPGTELLNWGICGEYGFASDFIHGKQSKQLDRRIRSCLGYRASLFESAAQYYQNYQIKYFFP